jgi:hypothetical protein
MQLHKILLNYLGVDTTCIQRKRLGVVGEFYIRLPTTEAKLLIKSLKFIQMSNRIPSSPNWCKIVLQKLRLIPSSPNNAKPNVVCSQSQIDKLIYDKSKTLVSLTDNKEQQRLYQLRLSRLICSSRVGSSFGSFLSFPVGYGRKRY